MDATWLLRCVGQDVVSRRGDSKNDIVGRDVENACIDTAVLPSECIDILVIELSVLGQLLVIVDAPVMVLVPARRERKLIA
jgi:hypothetical protein